MDRRFIPARAGNTGAAPIRGRRRTVHPRSRGEHTDDKAGCLVVAGSSPLARGTRDRAAPRPGRLRFIPARAGNTRRATRTGRPDSVHPRSRGEHAPSTASSAASAGSSPLARGTPDIPDLRGRYRRFIPARAGNTGPPPPGGAIQPVHPRSRGEHAFVRGMIRRAAGSSPLARGTPRNRSLPSDAPRFIPARAGNTPQRSTSPPEFPVHPRSRGEHLDQVTGGDGEDGSSPLARGTLVEGGDELGHGRFIPARAGNTRGRSGGTPVMSVHPRSRGEHSAELAGARDADGSSPLARGTLMDVGYRPEVVRFIPARAGNTPSAGSAPARWSVHPRSRGEHWQRACVAISRAGSSPLARGTPVGRGRDVPGERFIPARAGNTPGPR